MDTQSIIRTTITCGKCGMDSPMYTCDDPEVVNKGEKPLMIFSSNLCMTIRFNCPHCKESYQLPRTIQPTHGSAS